MINFASLTQEKMEIFRVTKACILIIRGLSEIIMLKSVSPIIYPKPPLDILKGGFYVFASLFAPLIKDYKLVKIAELPFKPPYKAARLVNEDKPLTARWYIVFWVWDNGIKQMVRKRDYTVNKFATKKERLSYAAKNIRDLNIELKDGKCINSVKQAERKSKPVTILKMDYTVRQAFVYVLSLVKSSKRPATYNTYSSCANLFVNWFEKAYSDRYKIDFLHKIHIIEYLDFVQADRGLNNCTRNQYLCHTRSMMGMMVERTMLPNNPASGIKEEPEDIGGNTAYLPAQIKTLKEAITVENYRLWLFIQFIFYGFIRPGEIGRLKVKYINMDTGKIFLPGTITKNRKPRYAQISPAFKKYILELDLDSYPPEYFVFGHNLKTGPLQLQKNYASALHTKIARELKFGTEYTLYSWKHTGVILHYRAGIDIKTLQNQLGHWSLQETDKYLKSLGIYENREFELKSPVI